MLSFLFQKMEVTEMKLVIAEKPSVAMSLAAVLGVNEKKDGYLEGEIGRAHV